MVGEGGTVLGAMLGTVLLLEANVKIAPNMNTAPIPMNNNRHKKRIEFLLFIADREERSWPCCLASYNKNRP